MRILHPSLGLTALVAAFAVGLRTEEATSRDSASSEDGRAIHSSRSHQSTERRTTHRQARQRLEKERLPDPRLEELTKTLGLSHRQQAIIHPAILRATFGYDPETPYQVIREESPRHLGPPLTRADFEDALFAILDVDQQLDYAATVTEKEVWWNSVISRLEADLENQTSPVNQLPTPLAPEPPSQLAPSQGRDRLIPLPPATD